MSSQLVPQPSILSILKSKNFTRSAEIIPPRNGSEIGAILDQIGTLKAVPVDFISVTKGAGGSLRGGTLPIAQMVKERFEICSLAHFTCRDYTIEEIENNLMDHHYFGIQNILALRGDPPDGKPDHFRPASNRHTYAWQLVEQIKNLNEGKYIVRTGFDKENASALREGTPTDFCIGVAAHPEQEPLSQTVDYLHQKVKSGAKFAITQMLFSAEPYKRFIDACQKKGINIPILPGLRILTQAGTAERMIQKFGAKIPDSLLGTLKQVRSKEEGRKFGIESTLKLCQELKRAGAPGVHLFVMNDAQTASEVLRQL